MIRKSYLNGVKRSVPASLPDHADPKVWEGFHRVQTNHFLGGIARLRQPPGTASVSARYDSLSHVLALLGNESL